MRYILASSSPRRVELVKLLGIEFEPISPNVDEKIDYTLRIEDAVMDLAKQKVEAIESHGDDWVLGCDTVVEINGKILGKPLNEDDAYHMLKKLTGKTHRVITGCAIKHQDNINTFYGEAYVVFSSMNDQEIHAYIKTQEPFGKAGSYAIQGYAAKHIEKIDGDYYSVMGLPISQVYKMLKD